MKALFGMTVLPAAALGGIVLASLSQRIRDLFFVLLVFLAPLLERLDVNFVSREWYRGTSRGFEVSLLDILSLSLLASSIIAPRRGNARVFWPASLGLMLVFFCYACVNVAASDPRLYGYFELFKLLRGLVLFLAVAFYLRSERELHLLIFALGACVTFQALLGLKQRYLDGVPRVFGTVDDSNSLSVFFCTTAPFLVAALSSRIPKLLKITCAGALLLAAVGEILTVSRAGVIIIAIVLLGATLATVSLRITPRKLLVALVVIAGAAGITAKSWNTLQARFSESNMKEEYGNNKKLGRGYYIRIARTMVEEQWLGVGLNNWSYWASNKYGPRLGYRFVPYPGTDREPSYIIPPNSNVDMAQAAPAHSLAALTLGEMGIPGLLLLTLLWLRWFQMAGSFLWKRTPDPMRRMAVGIFFSLCGIFLQSLTEWVFRHSPIYYVIHILLGALAGLYYLKKQERRAAALEEHPNEFAASWNDAVGGLRPGPLPQGEGATFSNQTQGPHPINAGYRSKCAPSPRGDGWREGDRAPQTESFRFNPAPLPT